MRVAACPLGQSVSPSEPPNMHAVFFFWQQMSPMPAVKDCESEERNSPCSYVLPSMDVSPLPRVIRAVCPSTLARAGPAPQNGNAASCPPLPNNVTKLHSPAGRQLSPAPCPASSPRSQHARPPPSCHRLQTPRSWGLTRLPPSTVPEPADRSARTGTGCRREDWTGFGQWEGMKGSTPVKRGGEK